MSAWANRVMERGRRYRLGFVKGIGKPNFDTFRDILEIRQGNGFRVEKIDTPAGLSYNSAPVLVTVLVTDSGIGYQLFPQRIFTNPDTRSETIYTLGSVDQIGAADEGQTDQAEREVNRQLGRRETIVKVGGAVERARETAVDTTRETAKNVGLPVTGIAAVALAVGAAVFILAR